MFYTVRPRKYAHGTCFVVFCRSMAVYFIHIYISNDMLLHYLNYYLSFVASLFESLTFIFSYHYLKHYHSNQHKNYQPLLASFPWKEIQFHTHSLSALNRLALVTIVQSVLDFSCKYVYLSVNHKLQRLSYLLKMFNLWNIYFNILCAKFQRLVLTDKIAFSYDSTSSFDTLVTFSRLSEIPCEKLWNFYRSVLFHFGVFWRHSVELCNLFREAVLSLMT